MHYGMHTSLLSHDALWPPVDKSVSGEGDSAILKASLSLACSKLSMNTYVMSRGVVLGIAALGVLIFLVVTGVIVVQPQKLKTQVGMPASALQEVGVTFPQPIRWVFSHEGFAAVASAPSLVLIGGQRHEGITEVRIRLDREHIGAPLSTLAHDCYETALAASVGTTNSRELVVWGTPSQVEQSGQTIGMIFDYGDVVGCATELPGGPSAASLFE